VRSGCRHRDEKTVATLADPGIQQVLAKHVRYHIQYRPLVDQYIERNRIIRMPQAAPAIQPFVHNPSINPS
jgi:hypothetical protein